jgi:hypothetical protein
LISCIGMGLGARVDAQLFDRVTTYQLMYVLSDLYGLTGALLALWLRSPRPSQPVAAPAQPVAT